MNKKELWLRLCNYHFDHLAPAGLWEQVSAKFGGPDASTKAFANKLSQKLGWHKRFALQAVYEYKKFVYLGVVSDFVVTPSEIIDQVWHQHILFSKAYRSFCEEVIEYNFDHNPELIPLQDQTGTFSAQYLDTLELYKKEFGTEPPVAIWGQPKFDEEGLKKKSRSKKKEVVVSESGGDTVFADYSSDVPLYQSFDAGESYDSFGGFEGGDSGGAGAGGDWSDGDSSGGDSGGDSGSSCSSCSSACGGGD